MAFKVDESAAAVIRDIFRLYNEGWGYKKIANHLTDLHLPTLQIAERAQKEHTGVETKTKARAEWSIITVQGILEFD